MLYLNENFIGHLEKKANGIWMLALILAGFAFSIVKPEQIQAEELVYSQGWLTIMWGDESNGASHGPFLQLTGENGEITDLVVSEAVAKTIGGVLHLNRKYVGLQGWDVSATDQKATMVSGLKASTTLNVTSITPIPPPEKKNPVAEVLPAESGSKPWVSIMCKFSDFAEEPKNLTYFQGMYANTKPGMDHYWREVSYNTSNVSGSIAAGWFVLPHTEAYYNPSDTLGGTDRDKLATDCIAVADASVNFSLYSGINMMFNTNFDNGYAWGGTKYFTLDGVSKVWSITWEPPWGYSDITVIAHEMGHGYGLPHSSGSYGETYDNKWDVMSDSWSNCSRSEDPIYGCLGQHTISYHLEFLGWIPAGQKYTALPNAEVSLTLEQLALPETGNYKMAEIPIAGSSSHFYTVEVRRQTGYDYKLPGQAVIIHEVDNTRSRPAYVIDADGNGNTGDAGAMWIVGEEFSDTPNKIYVNILSATSTGFRVRIRVGGPVPGDVDFSGVVDLRDAIVLLQIASGNPPGADAQPECRYRW